MTPLYTPPIGYYDKPWSYVFDGSNLVNGTSPPNQFVYVEGGGLGDFFLRRVVGIDRVVNVGASGQFQMRDQLLNYVQDDRLFIANGGELVITPELRYPQTTALRFDLYNVLKAAIGPQVAFQGTRRIVGSPSTSECQVYKPKLYWYTLTVTFTSPAAAAPQPIFQKIDNYGFDLYAIYITYQGAAGPLSLASAFTSLQLYDMNKQQLSNIPVLDLFLKGSPGSKKKNGAIVPALYYDVNSQLRIDVQNLGAFGGAVPVTMTIHLVGEQRIPC
jgi:hypothetical protein